MKRVWVNVGAAVSVGVVTGAIVSACAHDDSSIFLRSVLAPTTVTNGLCQYSADISQTVISSGALDVLFSATAYAPEFLVGNQIVTTANQDQLQTETSRVTITGAITRITDLAGNNVPTMLSNMCAAGDQAACATGKCSSGVKASCPQGALTTPLTDLVNPFSTEESVAIEPSDGTSAQYAAIQITIVDSATVNLVREYFAAKNARLPGSGFQGQIELLTYTKVEGHTGGGDAEESNTLEFPVTLCYGCLTNNIFPDPSLAIPYCVQPASSTTSTQTCIPGQDVASPINVGSVPGISLCSGDAGIIGNVDGGG